MNTLLGAASFVAALWCASAGAGPYPFYQGLTADWLAGPWPPVSTILCTVTFLLPLRLAVNVALRERGGDERNSAAAAATRPNRHQEPVMYLAMERPPLEVDREDAPRQRPVLSFLVAVLVIVCVIASLLVGVLWWRGTTRADYVGWSGDGTHVGLLSEDGIVRLEYTDDEAMPAGWHAVSMDASPRLGGWQSSWRGDLLYSKRVGGAYGVAWQERRTTRTGYRFGDRTRRSLYLSHPFLLGVALILPLARVAASAWAARPRPEDDAIE